MAFCCNPAIESDAGLVVLLIAVSAVAVFL